MRWGPILAAASLRRIFRPSSFNVIGRGRQLIVLNLRIARKLCPDQSAA